VTKTCEASLSWLPTFTTSERTFSVMNDAYIFFACTNRSTLLCFFSCILPRLVGFKTISLEVFDFFINSNLQFSIGFTNTNEPMSYFVDLGTNRFDRYHISFSFARSFRFAFNIIITIVIMCPFLQSNKTLFSLLLLTHCQCDNMNNAAYRIRFCFHIHLIILIILIIIVIIIVIIIISRPFLQSDKTSIQLQLPHYVSHMNDDDYQFRVGFHCDFIWCG
jgi:hypothetical protein